MVGFPPQGSGGVGAIPSNTIVTETTYGQASTAGTGGTSSRGDHTHGTPVVPAIDDLSDVTIAAPAIDEILRYNGVGWVNGTQSVAMPGPGITFYLDSTKVIPAGVGPQTKSMETLLKTPSTAVEVDESEVVNNSTAIIDQYMYNTALGVTSIDAGEWTFDTYTYVDDAADTSEVIMSAGRIFIGAGTVAITGVGTTRTATVTGGTPFVAGDFNADITQTGRIITPNAVLVISGFTSTSVVTITCLATYTNEAGVAYSVDRYMFQVSTGEINELAPTLKSSITVQPAFASNLTDKLVIIYFAKTNHVGNVTVHLLHNGTEHYTRIHTPLATKHNDLAGLQGGVADQFYHLTQAEYTGTGTGNFVRETSPTITTPTIGSFINANHTHAAVGATGGVVDHTTLSNIGTNTHAQIDTAIGTTLPGLVTTHAGLTTGTHGVGISTIASAADIATHAGLTTGVHGVGISTVASVSDIATHAALTTGVHGLGTMSQQNSNNVSITGGSITTTDVTATDLKSATTTIAIDAAVAPTVGQVLTAINGTSASWQTVAAGMVSDANRNTKGGTDALRDNLVGTDNTAIGYNTLLLDTASFNTGFGSKALDAVTTGVNNTAVGYNAGGAIVTTNDTTCIGYQAGLVNTAADNTFIGSGCGDANIGGLRNTAVGKDALGTNIAGADNTMIGYQTGDAITDGIRNTAVGSAAFGSGVSGVNCTMIGYNAGALDTSIGYNTFIGSTAGDANTTGAGNTAVGWAALSAITTASECVAVGSSAGSVNTAANNTFIGSSCGDANTSGTRNVAVGKDALGANTTSSDCTMIGYQAGLLSTGASNTFIGSGAGDANTTGTWNTAVGKDAMGAGAATSSNTMIGYQAGLVNANNSNTFIGANAGDANTTGTGNTAVGDNSLGAISTGNYCVAVGIQAGYVNTVSNGTFIGTQAGIGNTTGADNTSIGFGAGATITTGANNVFIGSGADGSAAARANAIGIGKGVSVIADSTWVIGTIGIKQAIVEGANAAMGTATLVAGTIVVSNTLVTANSRIFLTSQDPNGGTQGAVFVSARTAATSFTITSTVGAADVSIVAYEIKEPN